jgi:O-6-methylguanine DNA methyltransferase
MAHALIPAPIGPLSIETTDRGISRLDFVHDLDGTTPGIPASVLSAAKHALSEADGNLAFQRKRPDSLSPASDPLSLWERDGVRRYDATSVIEAATAQLNEYFAGHRRAFDLPLDLHGTPFQFRVWQAIASIPYGETLSYADVALAAGNPNAYRAAGTACGANRIVILIPCHRVIGSDRGLHGFGGGLDTKVWLLRHENAEIMARQPVLARSWS